MNRFIYCIIISLFSILITKYLVFANPFEITDIKIQGNHYIANNIILEIIDKQVKNQNILNIDFKKIKDSLHKHDFIYKTKIYTEVKPIGLLENNGSIFFLSQDLKLINASYESINYFSNTPVITNLNNNKVDLLKIREILQKIMFFEGRTLYSRSEIKKGRSVLLPLALELLVTSILH